MPTDPANMTKSLSLLLVGAVLSACTVADIETPPIPITPNDPSASVGIDVYGRARSRGNPVPRFRGQNTVAVRTNGKQGDGGFGELVGTPCSLDSGIYKASFQTPANIVVPDYGPNSPALFVRCVHPDQRAASATVNAFNLTAQQRGAGAAGGGILGAIIVGAVNAAVTDPNKDEFAYPPITLQLK